MHEVGNSYNGLLPDKNKAVEYYRKACLGGSGLETACVVLNCIEKNDASACFKIGSFYTVSKQKDLLLLYSQEEINVNDLDIVEDYFEEDISKAFEYYQKSCVGGYSQSCYQIGCLYDKSCALQWSRRFEWEEEDYEPDYKKASDYYRKSCDGGSALGCENLARLVDDAKVTELDQKWGLDYYEKGCNKRNIESCLQLGTLYEKEDLNKATAFYQKECEKGTATACSRLGFLYEKQDINKAAAFYEKECEKKHAHSCSRLGFLYTNNALGNLYEISIVTVEKIEAAYLRECEKGSVADCSAVGLLYEKNDMNQAIAFYQEKCVLKNIAACSRLGFIYETGKGVDQDLKNAAEFYQKSCSPQHSDDCYAFLKMNYKFTQHLEATIKAVTTFGHSCLGRPDKRCEDFSSMLKFFDTVCEEEKTEIKPEIKIKELMSPDELATVLLKETKAEEAMNVEQANNVTNVTPVMACFILSETDEAVLEKFGINKRKGSMCLQDEEIKECAASNMVFNLLRHGVFKGGGSISPKREYPSAYYSRKACTMGDGAACHSFGLILSGVANRLLSKIQKRDMEEDRLRREDKDRGGSGNIWGRWSNAPPAPPRTYRLSPPPYELSDYEIEVTAESLKDMSRIYMEKACDLGFSKGCL